MIPRKGVVQSVLRELQEATESMGLKALLKVALEVEKALSHFQLPSAPCKEISPLTGIDEVAQRLYPADAPADLVPLVCMGEGNLLFDAVSLLLVGTTSLSMELQVRTVVEMLLWKQHYLCGMIDSKVMLQAARFSLCAEESEDMLNLPMAVLEAIFDADVKASCFPGSFANMWHVYALSSVLQCNIYSIYPMYNLKIRPYFSRLIRPRTWPKYSEPATIHIMWSGELEAGSIFKPHNFVALVQASSLSLGGKNKEQQVFPVETLELLNQDSQLLYSKLKDQIKDNITRSTFYRWRRQTQEHRKRSAVRYEAKHFFQSTYLEGKVVPLHQFKKFFPEISRSTYYAWKHELLSTGLKLSGGSIDEVSPGDFDQDSWSSPEGKIRKRQDSFAGLLNLSCEKSEGDGPPIHVKMQEAKRCLQSSIAMNSSLPYRIFKRRFPGISRSTYYNWRREALLFSPFKDVSGSSEESSDADKIHSPSKERSPSGTEPPKITPRVKVRRSKHKRFRLVYLHKKRLREEAKAYVLKSKMPFCKFKCKFPSISVCFYWLWRHSLSRKGEKRVNVSLETEEHDVFNITKDEVENKMTDQEIFAIEENTNYLKGQTIIPYETRIPAFSPNKTNDEQMFVMDVVALANFKAKAKLFLQQRFEEKTFPTFKEFRSYFPLTPRSTYYMWKRALHHGVPLIHG
ncbi:vertnin [Chanos chanos]|uniref:Vertnin n=1 Tax=Chanos chanos TaxID=29144 RepID=A0A6J2V7G4_CHACN|nr:vertnin [Chanos chanos]